MMKYAVVLLIAALALAGCGAPLAGAGAAAPTTGPQDNVPHVISVDSKLLDSSGDQGIPDVGDVAPDFQYTLSDGTVHKLSELRGKKVLINFWATWCDPCRDEMPDLQRSLQSYGDKVAVLGVNKIEQPDLIPPFAAEFGISFPLIANPKGDISNRYGAKNIPTSYFVNTDGTVGFRQIGVMTYDFMRAHLDQLK